MRRKTPKTNLETRKPLFFSIGLAFALAATLVAFEWRSEDKLPTDFAESYSEVIEVEMPPIYRVEVPKAPEPEIKIKSRELEIVDEVIEKAQKEIEPTDAVKDIPFVAAPDPEEKIDTKAPEVYKFVDKDAQFVGGYKALRNYLNDHIKYPQYAIEVGMQGKVYLQFVVRKNGSITDVKVVRGSGEILDKEAIRVVKGMPNWEPGILKGKPVDMYFNLPVDFRLQ